MNSPVRGGAALIMAMAILLALMLLGLPFLFSQSSSLRGSQSLAARMIAGNAQLTATNLGVALAIYATEDDWRVTDPGDTDGQAWTSLHPTSQRTGPTADFADITAGALVSLDNNRIGIDPSVLPMPHNLSATGPSLTPQLGVQIEDESGKLDPNTLTPDGWHLLLMNVGIGDLPTQRWEDTDGAGPQGTWVDYVQNDRTVYQLAWALARHRLRLPERRFLNIEQLLDADPQREQLPQDYQQDYQQGTQYLKSPYMGPAPADNLLRKTPLTHGELALLRPHLTLYARGQGRQGMVDLGNVVQRNLANSAIPAEATLSPYTETEFIHDLPPWDTTGLATTWSNLVSEQTTTTNNSTVNRQSHLRISSLSPHIRHRDYDYDRASSNTIPFITGGQGLAVLVPSSLNFHQGDSAEFAVINAPARSVAFGATAADCYTTISDPGLPADWLTLTDPLRRLLRGTGYELPLLDLRSQGVISVDAGGLTVDQQGRVLATQHGRAVMQAVPDEDLLERRWRSQADFHLLLAGRHGSQLQAWPNPYPKFATHGPAEPDSLPRAEPSSDVTASTRGTDFFDPTGLRMKPLPDLAYANSPQVWPNNSNASWSATFADQFAKDSRGQAPIGAGNPTLPDTLTPEGVVTTGSAGLAYPVMMTDNDQNSPLAMAGNNDGQVANRHLSLWMQPLADSSGDFPILDVRAATAACAVQIDKIAGSNDFQNNISLWWSNSQSAIVLTLGSTAIEHTSDGDDFDPLTPARMVPKDDPATPAVNELSLGSTASGAKVLAPRWPVDPLRNNLQIRRQFLYYIPGGLKKDRWYRIQLHVADDRPGTYRVLVDGIAGRDLTGSPDAPSAFGDHRWVPVFRLKEVIAAFPGTMPASTATIAMPAANVSTLGGKALQLSQIILNDAPAPFRAVDCLPARGLVRIDDEWIRYESINGNTLLECQRGVRQNTNQNGSPATATAPDQRWPQLQDHVVGALVVPGGFRMEFGTSALFTGAGKLADPVDVGDLAASLTFTSLHGETVTSATNSGQYRTWAFVANGSAIVPDPVNPPTTPTLPFRYRLDLGAAGTTTLPLIGGGGVWPRTGVLRLDPWGEYFAFTSAGGPAPALTLYTVAPTATGGVTPMTFTTLPTTHYINDGRSVRPAVLLVSIQIDETGPGLNITTAANRFQQPNGIGCIQIESSATNRVEWITYTHTLSAISPTGGVTDHFVLHRDGFPFLPTPVTTSRGAQRTIYAGNPAAGGLVTDPRFLAGSNVLPVQGTGPFIPFARLAAAGDVVTLAAKPTITTPPLAAQLVVRFAATDGYPYAPFPSGPAYDVINEWFSFTTAVPDTLVTTNAELLAWPCWSGKDLSPLLASQTIHGLMPVIDYWCPGMNRANIAQVPFVLGAQRGADAFALPAGAVANARFADLSSGRLLTDSSTPSLNLRSLDGIRSAPAVPQGDIPATGGLGLYLNFSYDPTVSGQVSLVDVDGEVMAVRGLTQGPGKESSLHADFSAAGFHWTRLVGRGLLGSTMRQHLLISPPAAQTTYLPAIPIRVGPVATLRDAMTTTHNASLLSDTCDWLRLDKGHPDLGLATGNTFNLGHTPAVMIADPNGSGAIEILGLVRNEFRTYHINGTGQEFPNRDANKVTAPPWLRGLYGTTIGNWTVSADDGPIVIGWFPRYPSALPQSGAGQFEKQQLTSRWYGWAGFPMRLFGQQMKRGAATEELAEFVLVDSGSVFDFETRALASGFDWSAAGATTLSPGTRKTSAPFLGAQFANQTVDGCELRLWWRYRQTATTLNVAADHGNRTPTITSVKLRGRAVAGVIAQETR